MRHDNRNPRLKMLTRFHSALAALLLSTSTLAAQDITLHSDIGPAEDAEVVDVSKYESKRDGSYIVGFSNVAVINSWTAQLVEEANYRASTLPQIERYIVTDANNDPSKQVSDVEDMLAQGADAIVINPANPVALVPVLERAYEDGVVVIVVTADANTDKVTAKIMADQVKFGTDGGEFLVDAMGGEGNVIALRGIAGLSVDDDRFNGAADVIGENPDMEIIAEEYASWSYDQARQACESLALAHPQIDGVWSSGGAMTQACVEVFNEFGRDLVPMTGEANNGFFRTWKENQDAGFDSIAPQNPTWAVGEGIALAVAILEGQEVYDYYAVTADPYTAADLDELYRPDLNDSYWVGSTLPEEKLQELFGN
ncbi:substrate-binding domain-containing protein [Maritimibacter sp. DP07]|uniref:Substrate-binding domain-containing protein n=1 Tax=Maritimibacter harenae TaxID=2606218 RepID=A0A845M9D3_9RHOB|nr:ABC transporter substrate-binding protein [Maritimibacter harenae]MZR14343.1 substrate-binding domain-containing protein [Maritimibacter harenae]